LIRLHGLVVNGAQHLLTPGTLWESRQKTLQIPDQGLRVALRRFNGEFQCVSFIRRRGGIRAGLGLLLSLCLISAVRLGLACRIAIGLRLLWPGVKSNITRKRKAQYQSRRQNLLARKTGLNKLIHSGLPCPPELSRTFEVLNMITACWLTVKD
jgi:hypothetical protein